MDNYLWPPTWQLMADAWFADARGRHRQNVQRHNTRPYISHPQIYCIEGGEHGRVIVIQWHRTEDISKFLQVSLFYHQFWLTYSSKYCSIVKHLRAYLVNCWCKIASLVRWHYNTEVLIRRRSYLHTGRQVGKTHRPPPPTHIHTYNFFYWIFQQITKTYIQILHMYWMK